MSSASFFVSDDIKAELVESEQVLGEIMTVIREKVPMVDGSSLSCFSNRDTYDYCDKYFTHRCQGLLLPWMQC